MMPYNIPTTTGFSIPLFFPRLLPRMLLFEDHEDEVRAAERARAYNPKNVPLYVLVRRGTRFEFTSLQDLGVPILASGPSLLIEKWVTSKGSMLNFVRRCYSFNQVARYTEQYVTRDERSFTEVHCPEAFAVEVSGHLPRIQGIGQTLRGSLVLWQPVKDPHVLWLSGAGPGEDYFEPLFKLDIIRSSEDLILSSMELAVTKIFGEIIWRIPYPMAERAKRLIADMSPLPPPSPSAVTQRRPMTRGKTPTG